MEARDEQYAILRLQKQLSKYTWSEQSRQRLAMLPLSKTGAELLLEIFKPALRR